MNIYMNANDTKQVEKLADQLTKQLGITISCSAAVRYAVSQLIEKEEAPMFTTATNLKLEEVSGTILLTATIGGIEFSERLNSNCTLESVDSHLETNQDSEMKKLCINAEFVRANMMQLLKAECDKQRGIACIDGFYFGYISPEAGVDEGELMLLQSSHDVLHFLLTYQEYLGHDNKVSDVLDFSTLPTFGGEEPESTIGVWSWDEKTLLVGEGFYDFEVVDR